MNLKGNFTTVAMLLIAGTLAAQDTTGTIAGRTTDFAGKPLAGTRVRITSPALLGERLTRTDAAGAFRIALLPNGEYEFSADAPGYLGAKGTFRILAGQTSHFDASLRTLKEVEKVQTATVEVIGTTTQVDKTDTVTQTNYSMDALSQMVNRDSGLSAIALITPGLSSSNLYEQGSLKIRGGTGHSTKALLNGVTITEEGGGYIMENQTLMDMVESMSVIQSPLNARYGNTDGGIISMVTTKGTNTFQGSMRLTFSRPFWGANDTPYPNRAGVTAEYNPPSDEVNRRYEVTIKGPIWKDHITFAYGGTIVPTQYYTTPYPILANNPAQATDPSGTFFRDPANGSVIRKTNLWSSGKYTTDVSKETFNQFVVFAQLSPNHSLEWNYSQSDSDYISTYGVLDGNMSGNDAYKVRTWNLGYKGIIGERGVLEARFGRTRRAFPHPYSPDQPPIWLNSSPTLTQDAGGAYAANSLLEGYDVGVSTNNTNGFVTDKGDTFLADSLTLNYQHMLDLAGTHMIDMGMEQEKFQWNTQAQGAKNTFYSPGMIASDLTAADIAGPGAANPAQYAGKYIVFNSSALLSNLDPNYGSAPIIGSAYESLIPQVRVLEGSEAGWYRMVTRSYYLNDLWSVNNFHSVMLGLRYDQFKVEDSVKTIASYGLPTVRMEYKFDVNGDQSRIINASFAQFHSRQPGSLFYPMVVGRLADSKTLYWNQGTANPYLVDQSQLLNLDNYGYTASQNYAGRSFTVDSNWKAPISNELTLGFRRNYASGANFRTTFIYRKWTNLFDFFPGEVFTAPNGNAAFKTVLKNDNDAERTYKSVEIEWSIPFTRKFTFGGNYTFARLMSNVRNLVDNPSRSSNQANNSANFRAYYSTLMPRDAYNPVTLRDPEHMVKWYATYDLSRGQVKSNLALRGSYRSGLPASRTMNYGIPYTTVPGYYDGPNGPNKNTGGMINTLAQTYYGGQFTNQDFWDCHLQYNLEFPVVRTLMWFTNIQVNNLFNARIQPQYNLPAQAGRDALGGTATVNPYGYQMGANLVNATTKDSLGVSRYGLRSVSIQTGIRF